MQDTPGRGSARETRLLLVTIAVSIATLLLLARFRFPDEQTVRSEPTPAPLERLAARATFDELASIMADLERRIAPAITILAVRADTPAASYVPAPRLSDDRAVALVGRDEHVFTVDTEAPPTILNRDPTRNLVVVQVPPAAESALTVPTSMPRQGPRYVAVVEATRQGPTVRPVYIGRTDILQDPRGSGPLLSVGAAQQALSRGAAIFSLDGAFIGLAAEVAGGIGIIPGEELRKAVQESPVTAAGGGDLGVEVQTLTPVLATAAGATSGVIVSYVDPVGASASALQPGDIIQAIDGTAITTVAGFQQVSQSRTPGAPVVLRTIRRGNASEVKITAGPVDRGEDHTTNDFGALLRALPGAGAEVVSVTPDRAGARGGLQRGDIVTWVEGRSAPEPAIIERTFRSLASGGTMMLTVQRGVQHRLIAVQKP
jgi:S1-C subfamily serine protease